MGGKEWPNILQKILLLSWMPRYLDAAATGSYAKFWPALYEAWFLVNKARLALLPDMDSDGDPDNSDDDEEVPNNPKSDKRIALIKHLHGLTPEGRLAWQVQQGLIRDQSVCFDLLLVYDLH